MAVMSSLQSFSLWPMRVIAFSSSFGIMAGSVLAYLWLFLGSDGIGEAVAFKGFSWISISSFSGDFSFFDSLVSFLLF